MVPVRADNKAAEHSRLYRKRHKEEINQRRKDIRQHHQNSLQTTISDVQNINRIEQITQSTLDNQQSSNLHARRQQRYYERHKEEINKRKRDGRQKQNILQSIPATAAERNRRYRERNKQEINKRRRDSRRHQQNVQQKHTERNINNIYIIEETAKITPNDQQDLSVSNGNILQEVAKNFTSTPQQYNTRHFEEANNNRIQATVTFKTIEDSKMELHNISQHNKIAEGNLPKINIKQEVCNLEVNEDIQVKTEMEYSEETLTGDNPFADVQLQIKTEYTQSPIIDKEIEYRINEASYEVMVENNRSDCDNYPTEHPFRNEDVKSKFLEPEETITNIYDDSLEIKQEEEIQQRYDYANFDDNQSMDSNEAQAINNVETCYQDEFKIKCENEFFGAIQHEELNKMAVKDEYETTVTETHLISNKLINTTSTVTNPQDGLTKSQTTKTLVMEIFPMPGSVSLSKIGNPEEILPTSYPSDEYPPMEEDDFQLNSITGDVMSLEQEAYGLLQPKPKTECLDRPYVCTKCPKAYKSAACLRKHKQVHESIEKRAMGIIKGQKTRMANMKKKLKQEEKCSKKRVKKEIKVEIVTPVAETVKREGYECTCGNFFRRRSRMETCLRSHNMSTDHSSYFPCVTCSRQFKDKEELSLHRKRLHRKRFPCKFCPTDYNTRKELFKHLQVHQKVQVMEYKVLSEVVKGKQKLKCFMCAKTCTELSELKSHVMDDHKEPYICPHCNRTFSKIIDFGNHTKTYHPEVEGQSVLDVLEAFSKLVKAWKCAECEVQFHEPDKLAMHQMEKHGPDSKAEPQFQCIDCRRVFISQKGLTSHRRVHHSSDNADESEAVEKGVMCIECRKICKDSTALTSHMRLHSSERKYPCKFCDFRFATPEKRRVHAELHTGDMKYVCFICEYQCSSENRLKRHKASAKHIGMKEFLASGKQMGDESTSRRANDTPECDEWVVVKEEDKEEEEADSEEESSNDGEEATCNICGEKFESETKMLKHQNTHPFIEISNGDKPTRIFYK